MAKSTTFENFETEAKTGPTGPRTPEGKQRSSQNAIKFGITIGRVLSGEEEEAAYLSEAIKEDLRLRGALELQIGGDIVLVRLKKQRIDRFETHEFEKALMRAAKRRSDEEERRAVQAWRRMGGDPEAGCDPLLPFQIIDLLSGMKTRISNRGLKPDEDLPVLRIIYGNQPTAIAAGIMYHCREMEVISQQSAEAAPNKRDLREFMAKMVEAEILAQKMQSFLENEWDEMESSPDVPVFPPPEVLDQILRYRAANEREFGRCLKNLEEIRGLRGN